MRFIHMADVHLGAAPDAGASWSETRRNEIWETFRSSIADAREMEVDLLLIAGDLFHRQPEEEELREVGYLFSTIPRTRVVLIAGNHDHLTPASGYLSFPWPRNVVCLLEQSCECVRFPEIGTEVYGFSYDRQEILQPLCDDLHPADNGLFHILLAHGGDSRHIPMDREALARSGFDYIALGHIHQGGELIPGMAIYPGALEPIDCNDFGPHGYLYGETKGKRVKVRFVEKAGREYRRIEVPCNEEDTTFSVRDRLEEMIGQQGWQHIYRVTLTGQRGAGRRFDPARLMEYGMVLEVTDETAAAYHLEELKRRYHGRLIGRYIESFEGHERSLTEEKALRYGLEALLTCGKE